MANKGKPIGRFPVAMPAEHRAKMNRAIAWPSGMERHTRNGIITRYRNMFDREKVDSGKQIWGPLEGLGYHRLATRYEMMEYIIAYIEASGMSVEEMIAEHQEEVEANGAVFPTLSEIRKWEKFHPEFAKAMKHAEEIRGEMLTEAALRTVLDSPETRDPRRIKLEYDALKDMGSILNPKFRSKQVIQTEDITDGMTREQLLQQVSAMFEKHPEMKQLTVLEGEVIGVSAEDQDSESGA